MHLVAGNCYILFSWATDIFDTDGHDKWPARSIRASYIPRDSKKKNNNIPMVE